MDDVTAAIVSVVREALEEAFVERPDLLRAKDARRVLGGISHPRLMGLVDAGVLPVWEFSGEQLMFHRSDVEAVARKTHVRKGQAK